MNLRISSVVLGALLLDSTVHGQAVTCGSSGGAFTIAGSSTVFPIARAWANAYTTACPTVSITVEENLSSSDGASRLCSSTSTGVDIGTMSRQWNVDEATPDATTSYIYQCADDATRSAVQIEVAIDGLTVAMQEEGAGADCVAAMGGLTLDQLRWIYSSYSIAELTAGGDWNETASIPRSDGLDTTHLWSELSLDNACQAVEIKIAGADEMSGTFEYFVDLVLVDFEGGERIATNRPAGYRNSTNDADIVNYVVADESAIGYFGYSFYSGSTGSLYPAPIQNTAGTAFVAPNPTTIADGSYEPFARRIYMNVLQEPSSLNNTAPFITYGMGDAGTGLVSGTGYSAIPEADRTEMARRVQGNAPAPAPTIPATAPVAPDPNAAPTGPPPDGCGPSGGVITIAGSTTVDPIARAWAAAYESTCTTITVNVEDGGSTMGANRLCAVAGTGNPVDIGGMSREWAADEAVSSGAEYRFECVNGEPPRAAIQIDVGIDGLSVTMQAGGAGADCVRAMGGLTLAQLRWIFSSYTESELMATGWVATALANSDGDDSTHHWAELSSSCPPSEIKIAGADSESGTFEYFRDIVLTDHESGETFATNRPTSYFSSADDVVIVSYVAEDEEAVGYFGYAYFARTGDILYAAPIESSPGSSTFVAPNPDTVSSGTYSPLSRRIYMNVLDSDESLPNTVPFLVFGMSSNGANLVADTGYSPIPTSERQEMLDRLAEAAPSIPIPSPTAAAAPPNGCGPNGATFSIAGSSSVFPLAEAWATAYESACQVSISVENDGSSAGASRVCAAEGFGSPVDIGNMSREWDSDEATPRGNDYLYQCAAGDTSRTIIQVDVAIDGISVTMLAGGAAATCVEAMGGLTVDQLRWIFSSYTMDELKATNWPETSLANSDGDDSTHHWAELSSGCPATEIKIAGADVISGTYEYFRDIVLPDYDAGERFASTRPDPYVGSSDDTEIVNLLRADEAAIGYFSYSYYDGNKDSLFAAPIDKGNGDKVAPTPDSILSGTYTPLSRRLYMNLLDTDESLANTAFFIAFGMSEVGTNILVQTGYSPIPESERAEMIMRVGAPGGTAETTSNGSLVTPFFKLSWYLMLVALALA